MLLTYYKVFPEKKLNKAPVYGKLSISLTWYKIVPIKACQQELILVFL